MLEAIDEYPRSVLGNVRSRKHMSFVRISRFLAPDEDMISQTVQDETIARVPHLSANAARVQVPDPAYYLVNREKI